MVGMASVEGSEIVLPFALTWVVVGVGRFLFRGAPAGQRAPHLSRSGF